MKKTILKNGLSVISIPVSGKSTTVLTLVRTGSLSEDFDNNGISHFLEHMCFKGTEKRSGKEIMRYLDGLGAETNAFTSFEYTGYYVKSIHKHWKKTLAVVSDIYKNSVFPESEIETEKGVVLGEIAMYQDQPTTVASNAFRALAYPDQIAGKPVIGNADNIKKIKRADLCEYHKKHYLPSNTTIVLAGDVDHKAVLSEVKKYFANEDKKRAPKQNKTKLVKSARIKLVQRDTEQSHVRIGYHAFSVEHKDIYAAKMLSVILGGGMSSRLFERIREDLGMGYYVGASVSAGQDAGYFAIGAGVDRSRIFEFLNEIRLQVSSLIKEGVSEKELKRARDYLLGNAEMDLELSDDIAYFLGKQDLFGEIESFNDIKKKYKSLTTHDIRRVARKIFKDDNLFCVVLGSHEKKDEKKMLKQLLQK